MSSEQKLIDLVFEIAQFSYRWDRSDTDQIEDYYNEGGREKHMEWVAEQLRFCGFDTKPVGPSWGVLKK
jgi:hypothetical protein